MEKMKGYYFKGLVLLVCGIFFAGQVFADAPMPKDPKATNGSSSNSGSSSTPSATDPAVKALIPALQQLPPFSTIEFSALGDLYITQSTEEGLTIEASDEVLALIQVKVSDKTLYLRMKDASKHTKAKIKFSLNIKDLQNLSSTSTGTVYIQTPLKTKNLHIFLDGLGEMNLNVAVDKLSTKIGGGGRVVVIGTATHQDLSISGAGEYAASKLVGQDATLYTTGSAITKINVSDSISVNATQDSIIKLCGKPKVTKSLTDSAIIMNLSKTECNK